ncbi:MAG: hypothetical protein D6715_05915 [Calditrichaeota bacterium]|nr:MAG: hypothetical protein D6715_05915 [Calditrichota bacterium]
MVKRIRQLGRLFLQAGLLLLAVITVEYALFLISPAIREDIAAYIQRHVPALAPGGEPGSWPILVYWKFYFYWLGELFFKGSAGYQANGENLIYLAGAPFRQTLMLALWGLALATGLASLLVFLRQSWPDKRPVSWLVQSFEALSGVHYIIFCYFVLYGLNLRRPPLAILILIIALGNGVLLDIVHLLETEINEIRHTRYYQGIRARGANRFRHLARPVGLCLTRIVYTKFPVVLGGTFIVEFIMNVWALGLETIQAVVKHDQLKLLVITVLITIVVWVSTVLNYLAKWKLDPRPVVRL